MSTLAHGREAYAERRWPDTVGQYTAADHDAELPASDLEPVVQDVQGDDVNVLFGPLGGRRGVMPGSADGERVGRR
ncbi:hypothetical protein QFZ79_000114 [Arthrobacter sp. V4I6]|uniref:hypothetical protein n=1 Tax=unclassified Arthrobacter TaxID=235627 RepID=UPI002788B561|nr:MULTISPECIES: hypothetical protein [unclassified Arthrobacter]MDQ0822377.1 hypothetical protein [Arthrobacter sp. V1I7]MDQ0852003.1 hypothetical protein [Arthrobacter sp. V4I6]